MIRLIFLHLSVFIAIILGNVGLPIQTLVDCEISKATIDGVQNVMNEHSTMIQLAKSNHRAKKTEIDSMKADIDFYMEENATEDDKKKWIDCVMKKEPNSTRR